MANLRQFIIQLLTRSDTKGAEEAKRAMGEVTQEAGGARDRLQEAEQAGQEFSEETTGGLRGMLPALAAGAAAIGAVKFALDQATASLKLFSQQELSETDLDSALASTAQLTEKYRSQIHDLAAEYQALTAIGDEAWLKQFAQLTRFGMHSKNVDEVAEAVKNLAGLLDGNLNAATMLIQRALEGQFEMFTRYGIKVERTGDQVRDLENLFELLAEKGGGLLEARAKTLDGIFKDLNNSFGDFREELGRSIANTNVVQNSVSAIADTFRDWTSAIAGTRKVVGDLSIAMPDLSRNAADVVRELTALDSADLSSVVQNAQQLAESLQASSAAADQVLQRADALASARLRLDIAQVDARAATGEISKEEAERQKIALRRAAAESEQQRHMEDIQQRRAAIAETLAQLEAKHADLTAKAMSSYEALQARFQAAVDARLLKEEEIAAIYSKDADARKKARDTAAQRAAQQLKVAEENLELAEVRHAKDLRKQFEAEQGALGPYALADKSVSDLLVEGSRRGIAESDEMQRARQRMGALNRAHSTMSAMEEAISEHLQLLEEFTKADSDFRTARKTAADQRAALEHRAAVTDLAGRTEAVSSAAAEAGIDRKGAGEDLKVELEQLKQQMAAADERHKAELAQLREQMIAEESQAAAARSDYAAERAGGAGRLGHAARIKRAAERMQKEQSEAEALAEAIEALAEAAAQAQARSNQKIADLQQQLKNLQL